MTTYMNVLKKEETIETLVTQFQQTCLNETFTQIYKQFVNEMDISFKYSRRLLPFAIGNHEIFAMMDDALLTAVENWNCEGGTTFRTYFRAILKNNRLAALVRLNAKKRAANNLMIHDADITLNRVKDLDAEECFNSIEGSELLLVLESYGNESDKQRIQSILIACDCSQSFTDASDKYNHIRYVTGLELSDSALRKRIYRAKQSFKQWLLDLDARKVVL